MPDPLDALDGLVHEPSQTGDRGVDLTLASVHRATAPGEIDFGGDEYALPETTAIEPERRDESDDYGWWALDGGTYLVEYNEALDGTGTFQLQPHQRLVALGGTHPTVHVSELGRVPLTVPDRGLALKENARVSTLLGRDGD